MHSIIDMGKLAIRLLVCLAAFISISAHATASLDRECAPKGIQAQIKSRASPVDFWTSQIKSLENYRQQLIEQKAINEIARRQAKVNEEFEREKNRVIGLRGDLSPEDRAFFEKMGRETARLEQEIFDAGMAWVRKCSEVARSKLIQPSKSQ